MIHFKNILNICWIFEGNFELFSYNAKIINQEKIQSILKCWDYSTNRLLSCKGKIILYFYESRYFFKIYLVFKWQVNYADFV